jgi:HPt (histidine-containing phosphotransfer) domain-containing protein
MTSPPDPERLASFVTESRRAVPRDLRRPVRPDRRRLARRRPRAPAGDRGRRPGPRPRIARAPRGERRGAGARAAARGRPRTPPRHRRNDRPLPRTRPNRTHRRRAHRRARRTRRGRRRAPRRRRVPDPRRARRPVPRLPGPGLRSGSARRRSGRTLGAVVGRAGHRLAATGRGRDRPRRPAGVGTARRHRRAADRGRRGAGARAGPRVADGDRPGDSRGVRGRGRGARRAHRPHPAPLSAAARQQGPPPGDPPRRHTLKGAAASVGFTHIAKLAHRAEDLLDVLYDGDRPATPGEVELLFAAHDALEDLAAGRAGEEVVADLAPRFEAAVAAAGTARPASERAAGAEPATAAEIEIEQPTVAADAAAVRAAARRCGCPSPASTRS